VNRNELIPSARRMINSLRDLGYDFASAVADLVDNSIEAGATVIAIDVEFDGDDSWVRIADNGCGMSPAQLREALRYGAERDYDEEDLGKFGLGLKTASLSQCRRLTVASRTSPQRASVTAYCWDLGHIGATDRWEILPVGSDEPGPSVRGPLKETTGTVVLWQRLDRMLGYQLPYGVPARKRLLTMCRELETHLGMVFHRFLAGEIPGKKLTILINGNEVAAWDPFARGENKLKTRAPRDLTVEHEGVTGVVRLEPYVLPHQQEFSSPDAFRRASGPASWNQQQGFYIYRAGRLIQSGGWCRLRAVDEHTKLARISVSFNPILDDAFKINVAKMRVQLPSEIRLSGSLRRHTASGWSRRQPPLRLPLLPPPVRLLPHNLRRLWQGRTPASRTALPAAKPMRRRTAGAWGNCRKNLRKSRGRPKSPSSRGSSPGSGPA
jgi:hypothetical protein